MTISTVVVAYLLPKHVELNYSAALQVQKLPMMNFAGM